MQPVLVSRFLLNLRSAADSKLPTANEADTFRASRFTVPGFRIPTVTSEDIIGNLGEPLHHNEYASDVSSTIESSSALDDVSHGDGEIRVES